MAKVRAPIAFEKWEQPLRSSGFHYGRPQSGTVVTNPDIAVQAPHLRPRVTPDCFRKPTLKDPTLPIGPEHKAILIASEFHMRDVARDNMRLRRWLMNHRRVGTVGLVPK